MKKKFKIWIFCLVLAFLFLAIGSKSSFLYAFNDWMDANCFLTMGKGLLHGKVLYLELFDQKGPLLFFYYMISAIVSYRSFIGVFLIEIFSFSWFLYFFYKACNLYLKKVTSIATLPIICFLIIGIPTFSHGGSAEEFCLPFLMYGLYQLLAYFKSKKELSNYFFFMNGLMAGLVFTIKYNLLGFWFAFMGTFFFLLLFKKEYKKAFQYSFVFLLGMAIPLIPWIIYFLANGALSAFIDSYLLFNIKYCNGELPLFLRILMIFTKPFTFMAKNAGIGLCFIFGFFYTCLSTKILKYRHEKAIIFLTFIFLCFGVFGGGISFRYYYLILCPFAVLGIISLGLLIEKAEPTLFNKNKIALFLILLFISLGLTFYGSNNTKMMIPFKEKNDFVQFQFAKIINKKKDSTILNYGFLDGGFYTTTEKLPMNRFFQKQNIKNEVYPYNMVEQNNIVKNRQVDFVITGYVKGKESHYHPTKYLDAYYKIRMKKCSNYEEKKICYLLWEKRKDI